MCSVVAFEMQLFQALRVREKEIIALVGAGGKSSALFRLADELVTQDKRVLITTTTRLGKHQLQAYDSTILRYNSSSDFLSQIRNVPAQTLIVGEGIEGDKVAGVPPAFIDELAAQNIADVIIYEADGARMLPFKAPAAHEPVVAKSTTLLVPVFGARAFGAPIDDAHVHRPEIIARIAGMQLGESVTPVIAARVLAHSEGGLKNKPPAARSIVLVNQVENESQLNAARTLARLLLGFAEIDAVAIGAAQQSTPIRETHRRVTAIVLAAGGGTRMQGQIKQLLPWRGKTLIENAIAGAVRANVNEVIVVLGAHAEEIRPVVRATPARVIINAQWATGHSTSIRAGLNALTAKTDAAIFINGDQPFLTTGVIDSIIQRYRETDASIVAPLYAGKHGSPALFNRAHFHELENLQGEQGGREILMNYPVERVQFADARLGFDVDTPEDYAKSSGDDTQVQKP